MIIILILTMRTIARNVNDSNNDYNQKKLNTFSSVIFRGKLLYQGKNDFQVEIISTF